jgi:hypothetical protein
MELFKYIIETPGVFEKTLGLIAVTGLAISLVIYALKGKGIHFLGYHLFGPTNVD